jgi:hypothetical protein
MKSVIREKRRLTFGYRRITPNIIRAFSDIIENEITELKTEKKAKYYILYSVDATDNTSFESQSNEIFKENQIIETRNVRKIVMRFYTLDNSKNIEIQIVHSVENESSENFILVSGDYPNWVNGILKRLSEIIELAEIQPRFKNNIGYLSFFTFILFNTVYFRLIFNFFEKNSTNQWIIMFLLLGVPFLSILFFTKLNENLKKLWPSIELQTGPNYLQKSKTNRNKAQLIVLSIILPLVLALVYDLVKSNF